MAAYKFQLGTRIKDLVTQLTGIATSRVEYLNGCVQYGIRLPLKEGDTKYPDAIWIDENQLVFVDDGIHVNKTFTGGPEQIAHDFNG